MGGKGSGIAKGRVPSVATVSDRAWTVGTMLHSEEWEHPRKILKVTTKSVCLVTVGGGGKYRPDIVKSFPHDVAVLVP
jgi:hypothetical protein